MQKKIIALAVAGLVSGAAFAQSNVTIYGVADVGYLNQDLKYSDSDNDRAKQKLSRTGFDQGALQTSRLGFRGTEDLGNGLTANFTMEFGYTPSSNGAGTDTPSALTQRLAFVGLSGKNWGSFNIGRQNAVTDDAWAAGSTGGRNNAFGALYTANLINAATAAFPSTVADIDNTGGLRRTSARLSDAWTYRSPSMSGLNFAAQYGKTEVETNVNALAAAGAEFSFYGLSASYSNGPINVALAYGQEKTDSAKNVAGVNINNKQWTLGGNYNFGVAKVFGLITNGKNAADAISTVKLADSNGWELGVHVPVTSTVTLLASYMDGKHTVGVNGVVGEAKVDYKGFQLGALYSLSKRTTAYAMYGDLQGKVKETGWNAKVDVDQFAVGLRHSF